MSKSFAKKDIPSCRLALPVEKYFARKHRWQLSFILQPFCHNMILSTMPSEGLRMEQESGYQKFPIIMVIRKIFLSETGTKDLEITKKWKIVSDKKAGDGHVPSIPQPIAGQKISDKNRYSNHYSVCYKRQGRP